MEKWHETLHGACDDPSANSEAGAITEAVLLHGAGGDPSANSEATAIIEAVFLLFTRRYWSQIWVI